jgi:hypothetical protein
VKGEKHNKKNYIITYRLRHLSNFSLNSPKKIAKTAAIFANKIQTVLLALKAVYE